MSLVSLVPLDHRCRLPRRRWTTGAVCPAAPPPLQSSLSAFRLVLSGMPMRIHLRLLLLESVLRFFLLLLLLFLFLFLLLLEESESQFECLGIAKALTLGASDIWQ